MSPRSVSLLVFWSAVLVAWAPAHSDDKPSLVVGNGRVVWIEYTLTLDDGVVADSNLGGEPLMYFHGKNQILPALEEALIGMAVGERKRVELSPEQGYGPVDPIARETVALDLIPEESRLVGAELIQEADDGSRRAVRVLEVGDSEIVIDLNHALAGKTLRYEVRIVAIE